MQPASPRPLLQPPAAPRATYFCDQPFHLTRYSMRPCGWEARKINMRGAKTATKPRLNRPATKVPPQRPERGAERGAGGQRGGCNNEK